MSFEWSGSFNASQFARFAAFARSQLQYVGQRLNHLVLEQQRIGVLTFSYDANGQPVAYSPQPAASQLGRLLAIYEILGGDAFFDLNIRTITQPVFLVRADETSPAQLLSNGEILGTPGKADGITGELMGAARGWLDDTLQSRRDYLEHKIRRLVDYQDQLAKEQELLTILAAGVEIEDSLEGIFAAIQTFIDDATYRPVYNDHGSDPLGKLTGAPMLPYAEGPDRDPSSVYGRSSGDEDVHKPGQFGGNS